MKAFDKKELTMLREEIRAALKKIEDKHGITLELGNINFTPDSFEGKLKAFIKDANASSENKKDMVYLSNLKKGIWNKEYGVTVDMYGKSYTSLGKTYIFVGIDPKKYKYPIVFRTVDGKYTAMTVELAKLTFKSGK